MKTLMNLIPITLLLVRFSSWTPVNVTFILGYVKLTLYTLQAYPKLGTCSKTHSIGEIIWASDFDCTKIKLNITIRFLKNENCPWTDFCKPEKPLTLCPFSVELDFGKFNNGSFLMSYFQNELDCSSSCRFIYILKYFLSFKIRIILD
jgi:hypothetical protein